MIGSAPTPLDIDRSFLRSEFFSGGPSGLEGVTKLRVFTRNGRLLHTFDSMLVTTLSAVDTERVTYFLKANAAISLYAFGRAVNAYRVQCILIDGKTRGELIDSLTDGVSANTELVGVNSRQAYEEFMALYETEFRISKAVRRKRKVQLEIRGYNYTGFIVSEKSGYASNADWICITNFEFIVLRSEIIAVPQSKLALEHQTKGEGNLLENTPGIKAAREGTGLV